MPVAPSTMQDAGFTALTLSAMRGQVESVRALLAAGADAEVMTTPLQLDPEIHKKMVEAGTPPAEPKCALDYAEQYRHPEIVQMLTASS